MAVFRVEKTRDYTVMSNHHLRNTLLSLKGKGMMSLMLSLPENWDFTTKGLASIRPPRYACITFAHSPRSIDPGGTCMHSLFAHTLLPAT